MAVREEFVGQKGSGAVAMVAAPGGGAVTAGGPRGGGSSRLTTRAVIELVHFSSVLFSENYGAP